ncbi:MAG TPA: acyltransferase [Kofleriaceae bacterium]|nr:acyltransferase [Kofleriaceae bacterium]
MRDGGAGGPPPFVPALTGVRAFAALWVMLLHLTEVTSVLLPDRAARAFGFVAWPGALGVDVFFVLSGFIISYNYEAKFATSFELRRYLGFLRARLARIYPVHLVLLVALVVVVRGLHVQPGGHIDPARWSTEQLVESFVLVQAWIGHTGAWNAVSWSISSEWLAYLLFPAMVRAARAIVRLGGAALVAAVLALALVPGAQTTLEKAVPSVPIVPPVQIVVEFLLGCVMYQLYRQRRAAGGPAAHPGWLLAAIVAGAAVLFRLGASQWWIVPLVPPMILGLAYGAGRLTRIFAHPVMVYGGKISFALYMTHYLWIWVMHYLFPLSTLVTASLPVRVGWVLAHALPMPFIAAATYHLVEEPARHWLMRGVRRGGAAA